MLLTNRGEIADILRGEGGRIDVEFIHSTREWGVPPVHTHPEGAVTGSKHIREPGSFKSAFSIDIEFYTSTVNNERYVTPLARGDLCA